MKRYGVALLALALLGRAPLPAQGPPFPSGTSSAPGGDSITASCGPVKTGCSPIHYTKEVKKVTYTTGCETICPCFFHGLFQGGCGCDKGHCNHPVQVRYLVKKVSYCPQEAVKCVPTQVPACGNGQPRVGHHAAEAVVPADPVAVNPGTTQAGPR